jgi:hypothetical protein
MISDAGAPTSLRCVLAAIQKLQLERLEQKCHMAEVKMGFAE